MTGIVNYIMVPWLNVSLAKVQVHIMCTEYELTWLKMPITESRTLKIWAYSRRRFSQRADKILLGNKM